MSSEVKLVILISTQAERGQEQVDEFEKLAPLIRNEEGPAIRPKTNLF